MLNLLAVNAVIAMAQPQNSGTGGQGSLLSTLMPLVVIFGIFYFLMIRPQQKQQKKVREMLSNLQKGDRVVTRGGVLGTIYGLADNIITLEVAENVKMKFTRDAITGIEQTKVQQS